VGATSDPGHRDVCRAHAPAGGHLAHAACDLAIDVVAVILLVDIVGRAGGSGVAREEAARKGAEGRDASARTGCNPCEAHSAVRLDSVTALHSGTGPVIRRRGRYRRRRPIF